MNEDDTKIIARHDTEIVHLKAKTESIQRELIDHKEYDHKLLNEKLKVLDSRLWLFLILYIGQFITFFYFIIKLMGRL